MSAKRTADGSDTYRADYAHDSSYGRNRGNRWIGISAQAPSDVPVRTEHDKRSLTYTSAPMSRDTEVTGHPVVRFWVSSTADYGDFFVYLSDVDPAGKPVLVTEGLLRAGFARLVDNNKIIAAGAHGIDVLPELPWHGFEKADYVDKILAGNKIVELVIDLHPMSWVFRKEHRLRVSIACSDTPTFRLHPKLCPNNKPDDPANTVPVITVHHDPKHQSHIELPIIPPN